MSSFPSLPTTRWTVVFSAGRDDAAAREEFARRYGPVIRRYLASRWHLSPQSEEVWDGAQETFLECLRDGGALEKAECGRGGGFRAYLYGVTRNVARAIERKRRLRCFDLHEFAASAERPSEAFDRSWARMIAGSAMEELGRRTPDPLELRVLRLRYYEDLLPRQIADRIGGLSPRRVSKLIETGLHRYRACVLDVLRSTNPLATRRQLEDSCREFLSLL